MLCLLTACNKDKSQTEPPADVTPTEDAAAAETETTAETTAEPAIEPAHLDVSKDKSGALARAAAALEAEGIDNEDLRVMSHHTESMPSAAVVCQHMAEVQGATGGIQGCIEDIEHHVAELGPELWADAAACFLAASTPAHLDVCVAAEKEAEKLLLDEPHGEGLDKAACEGLFEKFKTLTLAETKDDEAHVTQVLGWVRDNVVRSCMAHGTQGEIDCSTKAKTLHALQECSAAL